MSMLLFFQFNTWWNLILLSRSCSHALSYVHPSLTLILLKKRSLLTLSSQNTTYSPLAETLTWLILKTGLIFFLYLPHLTEVFTGGHRVSVIAIFSAHMVPGMEWLLSKCPWNEQCIPIWKKTMESVSPVV